MRSNYLIDIALSAEGPEPLTLEEVKRHLNMQFDTTEGYEFNDDNTLLNGLITSCRKRIEKYTGVSCVPKTIRAILNNGKGDSELPYGPVNTITTVKDADGDDIDSDDYKVQGISFKRLKYPCSSYVDITYTAGYSSLPEDLKLALLEEIAFRYENRGTTENVLCESAMRLAEPHSRTVWLL